jgi:type VI secretion system protein ImpG
MDDDLLRYYEEELTFVRQMGVEFAKKYPKIASRLLLEAEKCEDPYTERLIESFAFLTGRIHKKIDDDFPEITEALLNIVYPHYIRPIPSMSVVKFETARKAITAEGYKIDKGTDLYSKPVNGVPCRYKTCYPVTLSPVSVAAAGLREPKQMFKNAQQAVMLRLKTENSLAFSQLNCESLRFFLNGPSQHVFHLYELLFNNTCQLVFEWTNSQGRTETMTLSPGDLEQVGFGSEDGLMPFPGISFPGYQLLFEYFCFPEKFLFLDLKGLNRLKGRDIGDTLDIWFYLDRTAKANLLVNEETFCLHAVPVVNLFSQIAEPIWVEQTKTDYQVVPEIGRTEALEVFAVESVESVASQRKTSIAYHPLFSIRHYLESEGGPRAFWRLKRQSSGRKEDEGTDVYLCFTDWNLNPAEPGVETITVRVTCLNRDLPGRLPFGDPSGDFTLGASAPVTRVSCLIKPTPTRRPSLGTGLLWRLISHLSLNYLSIVQGGEDALREMLKLYDFENSSATRQQINGIVSVKSGYTTKRIGQSFCRGVQTTIEFDEDRYVGAGVFLFASVLERFLAQYVSVNSFSQLIAKTSRRKEALKTWAPRNGNRILL